MGAFPRLAFLIPPPARIPIVVILAIRCAEDDRETAPPRVPNGRWPCWNGPARGGAAGDNADGGRWWATTRRYLCQRLANAVPAGETTTTTSRRRENRGPLTLSDERQILSFLQETFPDRPELQA